MMSNDLFWEMIETSWAEAEGRREGRIERDFREAIAKGDRVAVREATDAFFESLGRECHIRLNLADVRRFCTIFGNRVRALDTEALARRVVVGPMGYLNARHFIVALGQAEYEKAMADPESAVVCDTSPRIDEALVRLADERGGHAFRRRSRPIGAGRDAPRLQSRPLAAKEGAAAVAEALGTRIADGSLAASLGFPGTGTTTLEDAILLFGDRIRATRGELRG